MEWFTIYLLVCIEKIASVFSMGWVVFWIATIISALILIATAIHADAYRAKISDVCDESRILSSTKRLFKWVIPIGFVFGCIGNLIPSQKDMAIIVGSGLTYQAVTSESGKRIGGKAVELLEAKIDEALKDTKPEEKK